MDGAVLAFVLLSFCSVATDGWMEKNEREMKVNKLRMAQWMRLGCDRMELL
jgi:hypothetical protein